MSVLSEAPAPLPSDVAAAPGNPGALAARNRALLSFRDNALLLAYRISGNLADAEDILQNAYLKAVRAQAPQCHDAELRKWFLQLTAGAAKDWLRSDRRRRERERNAAMEQRVQIVPEASAGCEHAELKRLLNAEIAQLDEKFRAPICLHYEQGLTYEEVSEILGVPSSSLRVNASRGMQLLRERLDRPQRPVSAELLTAVLAVGTALTASQALAASIDQIVTTGMSASAAPAPVLQQAASGMKVFTSLSAKGGGLLVKVLIGTVVLLSVATATLGWLLYSERQARSALPIPAATPIAGPTATTATVPDPPADTVGATSEAPRTETTAKELAASALRPPVQDAAAQIDREIFQLPGANAPWVAFVPKVEPGADYVPPADVEALWQTALDLVPHVRVDRDVVAGTWSRKDNGLYHVPAQFSRIRLNCVPPEEYDFRIDFTRLGGETETIQMLPLGGATAAWHIESWKSHYWGPLRDNPHIAPAAHLANGRRHTSIIEVRKDTLSSFLDGELILRIKRDGVPVDAETYWRLPDQRVLGIGGKATRTVFHRVALREVTGKAQVLANDPFEAALDENYWTGARDLTPKTLVDGTVAGQWELKKDGALACTGQFARYQFNYAPPEEYDMRITFVRMAGQRDIVQILSAGGRQFTWKIGAELIATLDTIDGKTWSKSPVALKTPDLISNDVQHTSVFCVRKDEVRAYVDDRLMLAWKTDFSSLSIENAWKLRAKEALGIGSLDNKLHFLRIQVKELSGPGRDLPPANGAPNGDF